MKELSLYIHIPFCSSKCSYCDFYSRIPGEGEITLYLSKILTEIESGLSLLQPEVIPTIFLGGGTPSLVPPEIMDKFLTELNCIIPGAPEEWSIEGNPESLTTEHLDVYQAKGINRLSIGIQSFHSETLKTLDRKTDPDNIKLALELIKKNWTGSWNGDLICEVPGQEVHQAVADIRELVSWNPNHISLYTLTLEEGTALKNRYKRHNIDELIDSEISNITSNELVKHGWNRYEVSNYARQDYECTHNLVYWNMKPFLGVGASASSTLPGPEGPYRFKNPSSISLYQLKNFKNQTPESFFSRGDRIEKSDFFTEIILMGFRLFKGIPDSRFKTVFGFTLEEILPLWTKKNVEEGSLLSGNGFWRLSDTGMIFLNRLLIDALLEFEKSNIKNKIKVEWY